MIGKSTTRMRLCPYCTNSIEEDDVKCNYCKADLLAEPMPEWLKRDEPSSEPRGGSNRKKKFPIPAKFIWPAAMFVVTVLAFFAGGFIQRSELSLATQVNLKQLQAKDQIIQSQEAQLSQSRQQLNENSRQLTEMNTKFVESQKEVSALRQRLGVATREVDRLKTGRSVAATRTVARTPETAAPSPRPGPARRTADLGVYETTQATSVYENPSSAARVISQIGRGTRINVVSSAGDWLEVRSKHGNPPGYVRSADARQIARTN